MRVIAGSARRMRLVTPQGLDTRPTQDIIKETLFNMIQFDLPGSVFVDICAGSGQMGIEAISRGARKAESRILAASPGRKGSTHRAMLSARERPLEAMNQAVPSR